MIHRSEYMEVPVRVEYTLTDRALRLQPILLELIKWESQKRTDQ